MSSILPRLPRPQKADIARQLRDNLVARQADGPAEPALDAFIVEIAAVADRLAIHVQGKVITDAARETRLGRADRADARVDTWYRHIDSFLADAALDRCSPYASAAAALRKAASPDGLAHINDRIEDENTYCRLMLGVLRDPEHEATLLGIEFPMNWLDIFDAALTESETAIAEVIHARSNLRDHISLGRDAEDEWVDVMIRLRQYMASRVRRNDTAKRLESRQLMGPLLDAMAKYKADAAARATRRAKAASAEEASEAVEPTPS